MKQADPARYALESAPLDDEPMSEAERQAVDEAWSDRRRGDEPVPHDEVKRRFGVR